MQVIMRVGQLIRKRTKSGSVIGPYLRVEVIQHDKAYASMLGRDTPNVMLLRENIHIAKQASLSIPESLLENLKRQKTLNVLHDATARWKPLIDEKPEIIRFYSLPRGSRRGCNYVKDGLFVVDSIERIWPNQIKITIKTELVI